MTVCLQVDVVVVMEQDRLYSQLSSQTKVSNQLLQDIGISKVSA